MTASRKGKHPGRLYMQGGKPFRHSPPLSPQPLLLFPFISEQPLTAAGGGIGAANNRGYSERKVQENMECEIMMVLQEEAKESYR